MNLSEVVDPELLRRIKALELRAREVADGVLMGIHHAPHRGRSLEFAEHKEYTAGDDLKRIDWKVFAKSDRLYVKEFEDDTNITAVVLVDGSRSMDYAGEGKVNGGADPVPTKLAYASVMAGALSFLLLNQSDAVGLGMIGDGLKGFLPPRARQAHFHEITRRLASHEPGPGTDIPAALASLSETIKGRALILIFSDFLDDPDQTLKAIRLIRHRGHELALFHVLDPSEIEFPFERLSIFTDVEGPLKLLVDPRSIRDEYRRHLEQYMERISAECAGHGIDYRLARTDVPPARLLSSWLAHRAAATGARARR